MARRKVEPEKVEDQTSNEVEKVEVLDDAQVELPEHPIAKHPKFDKFKSTTGEN